MTDQTLNLLAVWIFVPSAVVGLLALIAGTFGWLDAVKKNDRERQLAEFRRLLQNHRGTTMDIDWMRFNAIPKQELLDLVAPYGWHPTSQDIGGASWWLRFTHQPANNPTDPRDRLAAELATAEPSADGRYQLDPARYSSLPNAERNQVITSSGWQIAPGYGRGTLALSRPGTTITSTVTEPAFHGLRPADLRANPAVIERARSFHTEHGFDPLDPAELDRLRARNNHWLRTFLIPGSVAGLLWASAPFPLIIGLQKDTPAAVITGSVMAAIATIASGFAWWIRRRRNTEIGPHLALLREFKKLTGP